MAQDLTSRFDHANIFPRTVRGIICSNKPTAAARNRQNRMSALWYSRWWELWRSAGPLFTPEKGRREGERGTTRSNRFRGFNLAASSPSRRRNHFCPARRRVTRVNRDGSRFPDRVKRNVFFLIPINHLKCHLPGVIILKAPVSPEVLVHSAPPSPPMYGDTPCFSLLFPLVPPSLPAWDAKLRIQWHANECTSSGERF